MFSKVSAATEMPVNEYGSLRNEFQCPGLTNKEKEESSCNQKGGALIILYCKGGKRESKNVHLRTKRGDKKLYDLKILAA